MNYAYLKDLNFMMLRDEIYHIFWIQHCFKPLTKGFLVQYEPTIYSEFLSQMLTFESALNGRLKFLEKELRALPYSTINETADYIMSNRYS